MGEIIMQSSGVFVGAFLAIGLENLRQRWMTRRWVRAHCAHLRAQIISELPTAERVRSDSLNILPPELAARWPRPSTPSGTTGSLTKALYGF